ncbi:MAG: hypothetical protein HY863_14415 [Chloroflexi bacterium]|nr:hypothetical protein [Chloroflexota bacterium]
MKIIHILLALLIGLGLGLAYSWRISPVTYVDANPAILRADFKDKYRVVIAASYASTHDLERARVRLELLGDTDPTGELSAQAQRMVGAGESFENVQPLAQLATDLQQGFASLPPTPVAFVSTPLVNTPIINMTEAPATNTPTEEPLATEAQSTVEAITPTPTSPFAQTALAPVAASPFAPRPTFTPVPPPGDPFTLVGQETVCEPGSKSGLLQFILMDARRKQIAGIEIIITSPQGEDHSFTGFKPELGNGYADFVMKADTVYSVRVVTGGASVPDISAPTCKDPNGASYLGGLMLTFQQP